MVDSFVPRGRAAVLLAAGFASLTLVSVLGAQGARFGPWSVPGVPVWAVAAVALGVLIVDRRRQTLGPIRPLAVAVVVIALVLVGAHTLRSSLAEPPALTARLFRASSPNRRPENVVSVSTLRMPTRRTIQRIAGRRRDIRLELSSVLHVPSGGRYRFELSADDRAALFIDERRVMGHAGTRSVELDLTEGEHAFRLRYTQEGGPAHLVLTWDRPAAVEWLPLEAFLGEHRVWREPALAAVSLFIAVVWFAAMLVALRVTRALRDRRLRILESAESSTRARYARFAVIQLVQIAVLVVLVETAAAFFTSRPPDWKIDHFRLNHAWRPNSARTVRALATHNPEYPEPFVQRFNAQRWVESYDVRLEKPPGVYRIFYLGDSFIEGPAPMEQNVPTLVETALNERYADEGVEYEVINTGTASYSPILYYILLRHYVLDYSPDLVVLSVDMTDDYDDHVYRESLIVDENGDPWAAPPRDSVDRVYIETQSGLKRATFLSRLSLFLYQHSYTYNFLRDRVSVSSAKREALDRAAQEDADALRQEGVYPRWSWVQHEWDDATEANVALTLEVIEKIATLCEDQGVKLVLTGVPHYRQYSANGRAPWSVRPHAELRSLAAKKGVSYLDSYEALRADIEGTARHVYYYRRDMHFNPAGLSLWARAHIAHLAGHADELLAR